MKNITTYIHFNGNCRTAMAFYRECFEGELTVMAMPDASGKPSTDPKAPVMHSQIDREGKPLLMASDSPEATETSTQDANFSVLIDCSSVEELEKLFKALSANGKVTVPPSDMPSGRFGMCADPFGISWMLNCAKAT